MLIATQLKRMFVFEENRQTIHLADPNPSWSVEQVKNFYSTHYPLLTNAKAGTPYVEGDSVVYPLQITMGTKGYISTNSKAMSLVKQLKTRLVAKITNIIKN